MASGNLDDDMPSSQSINDLLSESRKFLQTQKSLHSSASVTKSSSVLSSERQKSRDGVADGACGASKSPRSNTSVVNRTISASNNSNQSILSQPEIDKNTRSGFSSSSRSTNKNSSHVELDVIGGQNSQIKSQNSILSSKSMIMKQSVQNNPQTLSKKESSHRSIVELETSTRGSKHGLSAKEIHNSQIPTVSVTKQKSSSQSVSEKISAYLSRQSIVQQSESFNESRASSMKLKKDSNSVSLGSICFSSASANEFDGSNSDVRKKSQSGLLKSSISIPKVASFQQNSNTALKPSNCNLEDLTALSQQIVVSPNACTEKINIARSRHRMPPHSVERRKKNSLSERNSKSDTGNVSRASLSKSSSSSKRSLSQKISALLTRRSSNSGSGSKCSTARSLEKDKLLLSQRSSVQSGVSGSNSRHRSSDMVVVQAKSLSGKFSSSSDQTELISNSVHRSENTSDIKPKSNSRISITKSNSWQHSLKNSSNISNGQSKSSNLGSYEKFGNGVCDEMIQSKSGGGLSTSPSIPNVERKEIIAPACSRQSNVERRGSIISASSNGRPFTESPSSEMKPSRSIEVKKYSETSFKGNCELHSTSQLSNNQLQHDDGTSLQGSNLNTPQLTINGTPLLDNSYKSSHSTSSCRSHDINQSGSENGHDFHPPIRNSLSNFDEWLADRNKYLDNILNRINKLESDSSAQLHRHQNSESSNEDKFKRVLRIVRDQGRLIKDLERNLQAHESVISYVQEQSMNSCQSINEIGYLVKELYIYFKRLAESSSTNNKKFGQDIKDVCFTVYAVKKQLDALRSSIRNHTVSL